MRSDRFQTVGNNALRVCNGNAYPFPPVINGQNSSHYSTIIKMSSSFFFIRYCSLANFSKLSLLLNNSFILRLSSSIFCW